MTTASFNRPKVLAKTGVFNQMSTSSRLAARQAGVVGKSRAPQAPASPQRQAHADPQIVREASKLKPLER